MVTEKARPGEKHLLAIHVFMKRLTAKSEKSSIPQIHIAYKAIEDIAFEIECFIKELKFAQILIGGEEVLKIITREFDIGVFRKM